MTALIKCKDAAFMYTSRPYTTSIIMKACMESHTQPLINEYQSYMHINVDMRCDTLCALSLSLSLNVVLYVSSVYTPVPWA